MSTKGIGVVRLEAHSVYLSSSPAEGLLRSGTDLSIGFSISYAMRSLTLILERGAGKVSIKWRWTDIYSWSPGDAGWRDAGLAVLTLELVGRPTLRSKGADRTLKDLGDAASSAFTVAVTVEEDCRRAFGTALAQVVECNDHVCEREGKFWEHFNEHGAARGELVEAPTTRTNSMEKIAGGLFAKEGKWRVIPNILEGDLDSLRATSHLTALVVLGKGHS